MTTELLPVTAGELLSLPDDGIRRELIRGELRQMAPAGFRHGHVAGRIHNRLGPFVEEHALGIVCAAETGFRLATDPDTLRAPDVAFVSRERLAEAGEPDGFFPGAPDLAVEVVSPNDSYRDLHEKVLGWLRAGARMAIVADPASRTVTVYRPGGEAEVLTADDTLDGDDVVPGWRVLVGEFFG